MNVAIRRRRKRRSRLGPNAAESLEQRLVLTTSGLSWFDAPNLNISLAPDGTSVAGHGSTLFEMFDGVTTRWNWRTAIERGFTRWTAAIDADVALTPDGGQPFGTPGAAYNDPRFGEVRIAAIPINDDVFAISIPHDEFVAGTWAGDILVNSNADFESADDIFRVILHEAGHVLGLDHNDNPDSPMFEHGIPTSTRPTAADKDALRELYGFVREDGEDRDQKESDDDDQQNDSFQNAVVLNPTNGFPKRRYTLQGQIRDASDVDIYKFRGYEDVESELEVTTIFLRSTERERLIPTLRLFAADGDEIESVEILQNGNGSLVIQTDDVSPDEDYFIMIGAGAEDDARGQGSYHLTVSSRAEEIEPRELADGTLQASEPESLHTVYLARAQLLSLALEVAPQIVPPDTAIGVAVFDYAGDLITTTSAAAGETRSLNSMLLRAGTYYVSVRAQSSAAIPDLDYQLLGIKSTKPAGPLPSDPTGDPAFPCADKPDLFCYPNGHESPDPTHTVDGAGTDAPELDPYAILLSWLSWWPSDNVNDGWVDANADAYTAAQGSSTSLDVLRNDQGAGPLEIRSVGQPAAGTVTINPNNTLQFAAPPGGSGTFEFEYSAGVQQTAVAPSLDAGAGFGSSVDLFGNLAVVGSPYSDEAGTDSGAAWLFRRDGAAWTLVQKLVPSDGQANDRFGTAVAIDGTTIVVTSPRDDDRGRNSGSAYVFEFDPGTKTYVQHRKIGDPTGRAKDLFGESVAVEGSTVVVGARLDDGLGTNSGSAFVFQRNRGGDDNWGLRRKLKAADASAFSQFGSSVGISEDLVVVGARRDDGLGTNSGAVYIFDRSAGGTNSFGQVKKLAAGTSRDEFGSAVSISGSTVLAGAPYNATAAGGAGAAYFFEQNHGGTDQWGLVRQFVGAEGGDRFGSNVALDGSVAVIGSPTSDVAGRNAGAAHVFEFDAARSKWLFDYSVSGDTAAAGDQLGTAVAVASGTAILGVPRSDAEATNAGLLIVEDTRRDSAMVSVQVGAALQAAVPAHGHAAAGAQHADLLAAVDESFRFWGQQPVKLSVQFAELDGPLLGLTIGRRILIDRDAAGHGWSLNPAHSAGSRMSLATVVAHEVGHVLGNDDRYDAAAAGSIMYGLLSPGEHRVSTPPQHTLAAFGSAERDELFAAGFSEF